MKPIVIKSADAESIARRWGELRRVDRLKGGETVTLDVSGLSAPTAAFEAFFLALDRHAAARTVRVEAVDPNGLRARGGGGPERPARAHPRALRLHGV